jgi:hypothetical protein
MTGATDVSAHATDDDAGDAGSALAVLGMLAYGELTAFSRLAADAALAPDLGQRLHLSGLARTALDRLDRVRARITELGGDLESAMAPFGNLLVEFDERTVPGSWWERLLKAYVGYGVSDDFCRFVAEPLDPTTRDLVLDVLGDDGYARLVVDSLAEAGGADATLASRLALWGRRVVGESLGVVQQVLAGNPRMRDLVVQVIGDDVPTGEVQQRRFARLTAEHSRRLEGLGLTP